MAEEHKASKQVLEDTLRNIATGNATPFPTITEQMRAALALAALSGDLDQGDLGWIEKIINGGRD